MGNALSYFFGAPAQDEAPAAPTTTTRKPKPLIVANADVGTLDVEEISRALMVAVRQTTINEDRCNDFLTRLEGVKISYGTIKATGLGLAVHAVRKSPSVSVVLAAKAKRLRAKWKDCAEKKMQQEDKEKLMQQQMLKQRQKRKQQKKLKQPKGAKQQQKLKQSPQVQATPPLTVRLRLGRCFFLSVPCNAFMFILRVRLRLGLSVLRPRGLLILEVVAAEPDQT